MNYSIPINDLLLNDTMKCSAYSTINKMGFSFHEMFVAINIKLTFTLPLLSKAILELVNKQ